MFALNQGEVCTCPSRALIHESIYDEFMERAVERVRRRSCSGDPLDTDTMVGAQASNDQLEKILSYIEIGREEGAEVARRRRHRAQVAGLPGRLLRRADDVQGRQLDADLPGGDLRPVRRR